MKPHFIQLNLILAWLWILLGFISGLALGLFFHDERWLGGYASFKRRLYRLGHVSFFGLGAVNLFFYLTARNLPGGTVSSVASSLFVFGTITMPLCCVLMAHFAKTRLMFAVPVLSVIAGGILTLMEVAK
jgi:hypothetical protein